ncbi:MAG: alpha/beta hydrolase [Rhizomicrobium sp.]
MLEAFLSRAFGHNWSGLVAAGLVAVVAAIVWSVPVPGTAAVFLSGTALVLALAAAALAALALRHLYLLAAWRRRFPPPGRLVDVGGYRMHLVAAGEGGPTVVWIPGSHGQGLAFHHLHVRAAKFTRSIIFDRPGTGWSDTGPWPRGVHREAHELEAMLRLAGEKPPFLIAAHSFGGPAAMVFAHLFPERVAGLVLYDVTTPDHVVFGKYLGRKRKVTGLSLFMVVKNAFGAHWNRLKRMPAAERAGYKNLEPVLEAMLGGESQPRTQAAFFSALESMEKQPLELPRGAGVLGDIPIYDVLPRKIPFEPVEVLKSLLPEISDYVARSFLRMYRDAQLSTARLSSKGEVRLAPEGATHALIYEEPDFSIAQVEEMVTKIRAGEG